MPPEPEQPLPEGRVLGGRWRVVRMLRTGGMGTIYEVVHRETEARCALKVLLPALAPSAEAQARFRQEVLLTAKLESEHIVKVFDGGTDVETGSPYLVMELLRGEDLQSRVARSGPMQADEVVGLLRQTSLALARTHAAGIVHRDLKPENLFLTQRDDGAPLVKVLDLGVAKVVASASRAETTRTLGTPLYMAPEQVRGDATIGPAADLYALGQIAYALLVGEPYWTPERSDREAIYPVLMAITSGVKDPPSERAARVSVSLPAGFDAWFVRATTAAPDARWPDATTMIDELARALGVVEPRARAAAAVPAAASARPPPSPPAHSVVGTTRDTAPPRDRSRRTPILLALGLLAATAVAWSLGRGSAVPPAAPPASGAPAAMLPSGDATATTAVAPDLPASATGAVTVEPTATPKALLRAPSRGVPAGSAARPESSVPAPSSSVPAIVPVAPADRADPSDVWGRSRRGDRVADAGSGR